ncbi:MAG: ABC-2 family transporter protein [Chloroflexota bacterium]|nr:ABC-2 family transporter protein [Chloroflexota bacterium]
MLRYVRLWWRFAIMSLVREAEYRVSFAVSVLVGIISLAIAVLTYGVLYGYTEDVEGWSRAEVLMVLGCFRVAESLIELLVARNMWNIAEHIREGDMDYVLVRPVSSQFLASLRVVNPSEGVNALVGLGLVVYAGNMAGVEWSLERVAAALVFGICGLILLYSVWCLAVTFGFWFQSGPLESVLFWLIDTGRYPVTFFKGWVRLFLMFIFPVAFASTFPAQALRGEINPRLLLAGILMASLSLVGTNRFWNYGVRHYSSASS